jgi:hypothetical protein
MDKKPATRNASLPTVPANLRGISTPVPMSKHIEVMTGNNTATIG